MGFKTMEQFNETKYGDKFILQNDGDYADVIFLYTSTKDVLVADAHYVKSNEYSGYVHCNGGGCPACAKGIRVQNKLFIPLYNVKTNEIQFWDRTTRFEPQLMAEVFSKYPNPSEFVFRITRHGVSGDINTKYQIIATANNNVMSYSEILAKFNTKMPDCYESICRDVDAGTLANWVNSIGSASGSVGSTSTLPNYVATPRPTAGTPVNIPNVPELPSDDSFETDDELDAPPDFD